MEAWSSNNGLTGPGRAPVSEGLVSLPHPRRLLGLAEGRELCFRGVASASMRRGYVGYGRGGLNPRLPATCITLLNDSQ